MPVPTSWFLAVVAVSAVACGGATAVDATTPGGASSSGSTGSTGAPPSSTSSSGSSSSSSSSSSGAGGVCTLRAATSPTGKTSPSGCAILDRDTSACRAQREAAGLSGFWLRFSCRVTLSVTDSDVWLASDGQPDYASNYFLPGSACHEDYPEGKQNPNLIAAKAYKMPVARAPSTTTSTTGPGPMGMALNGVAIFDNRAAPGDDIYLEAATFDRCGAHPTPTSEYHYHAEPYSISYDDAAFIGVIRDGYPLYGRRDPDGSQPELDAFGGHTGVTEDSPDAPVYHYHVNLQTSAAATSAGKQEWFLLTGKLRGSMPPCQMCGG